MDLYTEPPRWRCIGANGALFAQSGGGNVNGSKDQSIANSGLIHVPLTAIELFIGRWPMRYERLPASVPAPPQARPSSPDCRDLSHPHWSTGCNPTKSHVQSIRAGSCRGCDTACPCRL